MGRKLVRRPRVEKEASKKHAKVHIAAIFAQHWLLYSSAYVIASTAYLIHTRAITRDLLPAAAILTFAGCASVVSVSLCNMTAWRLSKPTGRSFLTSADCLIVLSKNGIRLTMTSWIVASSLTIAFTVARHPLCLSSTRAKSHSPAIDVGVQCIVQRACAAASIIAMIMSTGLFILTIKTTEPYLAHLFGINKPPSLLPLTLSDKAVDRPTFSEMSFKCRSTSTFSSYTIAEPSQDSLYTLYPTRPEKAYGLGIYAPKTSAASFLTPRPSLKTIRSHASLGHRPLRTAPVPPLPVYNPGKYKGQSALPVKVSRRPQQTDTLRKACSDRSLRILAQPPATRDDELQTLDRTASKESLSSIYSRSVSGASPIPSPRHCREQHAGQCTNVANAFTRVGDGSIGRTQNAPGFSRAERLRIQSMGPQSSLCRTFDNDGAAVPAKLSTSRPAIAISANVRNRHSGQGGRRRCEAKGRISTWSERCNLPPLPVGKRDDMW